MTSLLTLIGLFLGYWVIGGLAGRLYWRQFGRAWATRNSESAHAGLLLVVFAWPALPVLAAAVGPFTLACWWASRPPKTDRHP